MKVGVGERGEIRVKWRIVAVIMPSRWDQVNIHDEGQVEVNRIMSWHQHVVFKCNVFCLRLPHGVHLKLAVQEAADLIGLSFPRSNYKNAQRENFLFLDQSHHLLIGYRHNLPYDHLGFWPVCFASGRPICSLWVGLAPGIHNFGF